MHERERSLEETFPSSDVFEAALPEAERALREQAVERPDSELPAESGATPGASSKLLYELRVHRIELEMQNEELRRAQLEIEASRSRYFELYDLAPVGYLTIAEKGLVTEANLTVAGMLGLARGELVMMPFTRFIWAEDQDLYFSYKKRLLVSSEPQKCELRLLRKGGAAFWARLEARLGRSREGTVEFRTALSDISERRSIEESLRVSEARHRVLFESSPDALMTLAPPSWRFGSGNAAALALFGARNEAEFRSRALWDYSPARQPGGHPSRGKALAMIELAMREGSHSFEWTCERAPGDEFRATVVLSRMLLDGAPSLQATVRDESEAQRQRAGLAQTERLTSMGMLAASVGHEINNPLSYLLSNLELLVSNLQSTRFTVEEMKMLADHALDGAQRVARISRVLNAFSRADGPDLSGTDLNRAIEGAITLAFNELRFRCELVQDFAVLPRVWAAEGKLSQVFLNLLINASHAMTGQVAEPRLLIRTWVAGERVLAEVVDTGSGISPQDIQHIFEPFFSTKRVGAGSGLGLPICRSILAEFGGDIRVESELGKGTRFVVSLPAWHPVCEAALSPLESEAPQPAISGRILVVDDEELILLTLKRLLAGHQVVSARSGAEAKAVLERDQAFDLVICDLMMPDLTGIDLHRWLAGFHPKLAQGLVFVTGGAFGPVPAEYLAQCSNLKIDKPFDGELLRRKVSDAVRRAQSERPGAPSSSPTG